MFVTDITTPQRTLLRCYDQSRNMRSADTIAAWDRVGQLHDIHTAIIMLIQLLRSGHAARGRPDDGNSRRKEGSMFLPLPHEPRDPVFWVRLFNLLAAIFNFFR